MTGRKLRPEEAQLWNQVARTVLGYDQHQAAPLSNQDKPRATGSVSPDKRVPKIADGVAKPVASVSLAMDAKLHKRLKSGKLKPEAKLDLHGMRQEQAHARVSSFIQSSYKRGHRLVLIITGKGGRSFKDDWIFDTDGVLKKKVPQWLHMLPLANLILQVTPAHRSHGGDGAIYVYLRRAR